jgi:hypothetical protein
MMKSFDAAGREHVVHEHVSDIRVSRRCQRYTFIDQAGLAAFKVVTIKFQLLGVCKY